MQSFHRVPVAVAALLLVSPFPAVADGAEGAMRLGQATGEIYVRVAEPAGSAPAVAVAGNPGSRSSFVAAEPVRFVLPEYPRVARTAKQEGRVLACFTIDEQGRVVEPSVRSSSSTVFDRAVLAALKDSRFTPARIDGQSVRSTVCRTWRFVLDGEAASSW